MGSKIGKHLQLCGRAHYCATRKNLDSRTQLDEPVECTSGGNQLLLYKILHLLFFLSGTNSLCTTPWESKKIINIVLMHNVWNFSFFGREDVSPTHSELCHFVSGSQAKHQVSSPIKSLLKNFVCISHHNNALARRDSVFLLLRCQGVWNKTCIQLSLSQILFQNLKNYSLGDVHSFCCHSWCDLMIIFDQISDSNNVYLSLSRFWMATSLDLIWFIIIPRNQFTGDIQWI